MTYKCENCTVCVRDGLLILPIRPTLVDKARHGSKVPVLASTIGGEYATVAWQGCTPTARLMRQGYIHVYYENAQEWDFYEVAPNGFMHRYPYPELAAKKKPPAPFSCSVGGANVPASMIGIRNTLKEKRVWIGYADNLWTKPTLKHYAGNQADRELRMSLVEPSAWIDAGKLPARATPLFAHSLRAFLPEFADKAEAESKRYVDLFTESTVEFDVARLGMSERVADGVRKLEAVHPSKKLDKKTLILLLDDPVGVAESAVQIHLIAEQRQQLWSAGGYCVDDTRADDKRVWKWQSKLMVDTLEAWNKERIQGERRESLKTPMRMPLVTYLNSARGSDPVWGPGTRWIANPVIDPKTGQPKRHAPGKVPRRVAYDHRGQEIVLNDGIERVQGVGTVYRSEQDIEETVKRTTEARIASKNASYLEHVKLGELRHFEAQHLNQLKEWIAHREKIDADVALWLRHQRTLVVLKQDFERQGTKLQGVYSDAPKLKEFVRDVRARLDVTEKMLAAGPKGPHTLKWYIEQIRLKPDDVQNWIARGVLQPFEFEKELKDPGVGADIYDGVVGVKDIVWKGAWAEARELVAEQAAQLTQGLLNAQATVISRMSELVYNPKLAKTLGLAIGSDELEDLRILWIRGESLSNFVHGAPRVYVVRMKTAARQVLRSFAEYADVYIPANGQVRDYLFEAKSQNANPTTRRQPVTGAVQQRLRDLDSALQQAGPRKLVVPLLLDESAWREMANATGPKITIVPDSMLGKPKAPLQVSQEFADRMLELRGAQGWRAAYSENRGAIGTLAGGVILQGWAAFEAGKKLIEGAKDNAELADSVMTILGGLAAAVAAGLEVRAMAATPQTLKLGMRPANVALDGLIKPMRYRMWSGVLGAAGAGFDAVAAYAKSSGKAAAGDGDAADNYIIASRLYLASAVSSGAGGYLTYRALAGRTMQQAMVRTIGARMIGTGAAAMLGVSLTGFGLILTIAGIAWSLYAMSLEDDDNEIFLDRSFFGKHSRAQDNPPFKTLQEEVAAFGTLAIGLKTTLEWVDRVGDDEVKASVLVARFNEKQRLRYQLLALPSGKQSGLAPIVLAQGVAPGGEVKAERDEDSGPEAYKLNIVARIANEGSYSRAKFEFAFWEDVKVLDQGGPPSAKDYIEVGD
jgi:hypothetical protein